jgi:hypothetical protein
MGTNGKDELTILIRERKVLRRISGPVCERRCYGIRTNEEVYRIYKEMDLVTVIKTLRRKWLGHVNRMEDHREPKRVLQGIPGGGTRKGKPRKRWLDDMEDDLRKMEVKQRKKAMDRTEWRKICEAAKVLQEL